MGGSRASNSSKVEVPEVAKGKPNVVSESFWASKDAVSIDRPVFASTELH
jgi:hypothetical protein